MADSLKFHVVVLSQNDTSVGHCSNSINLFWACEHVQLLSLWCIYELLSHFKKDGTLLLSQWLYTDCSVHLNVKSFWKWKASITQPSVQYNQSAGKGIQPLSFSSLTCDMFNSLHVCYIKRQSEYCSTQGIYLVLSASWLWKLYFHLACSNNGPFSLADHCATEFNSQFNSQL